MRTINQRFVIVTGLLALNACSNTIYFYETEKVSLTIEARPDSSQPVQGNFGLKQRVALVVPQKNAENGEALSSISNFRVDIEEVPFAFNPISIKTAFITGDAATGLNAEQASNAAFAIAGTSIAGHNEIAQKLVDRIRRDRLDSVQRIRDLCAKPWAQLTPSELKELESITGHAPYRNKQQLHQAVCNILNRQGG